MADRIMKMHRRPATYTAMAAIVAICVAAAYAVSPPGHFGNRNHVIEHVSAFEDLAEFLINEPEIEALAIRPDNEIAISVAQQGQSISFSDETLQKLVDLFIRTKVEKVTRRTNRLEYFAGDETKFGRHFQARVIRKKDIESDIRAGVIGRCSLLYGFFKPTGECLSVVLPDLGIHYMWTAN